MEGSLIVPEKNKRKEKEEEEERLAEATTIRIMKTRKSYIIKHVAIDIFPQLTSIGQENETKAIW